MPWQRRVKRHCGVCMYDKVYDKCLALPALTLEWPIVDDDHGFRPADDGPSSGEDFLGIPGSVVSASVFTEFAFAFPKQWSEFPECQASSAHLIPEFGAER